MKSLFLILLICISNSYAVDTPLEFDDQDKQQQYQGLLEELRCLVCQNQSLADSPADTAQDLRNQIYKMVDAGQPDETIIEFLVERYGDFVLYNPRLNITTAFLWFGPFMLLVLALAMAYRYVRHAKSGDVNISEEDRIRAANLLKNTTNQQND